MKWNKKGLICSHETLDLDWYTKNTMLPVPYLINDDILRIFITMCDDNNTGRIGYIDVNPNNPSETLGYSKEPVLDIGEIGTFDDSGVVVSCFIEYQNKLLMYYSGYQLCVKTPYFIFGNIAVANNANEKFVRIQRTPILDRTEAEMSVRSAPFVIKDEKEYKMWYNADCDSVWKKNEAGKLLPVYITKCINSDNPYVWDQKEGIKCFDFCDKNEYALSTPTLWYENGIYNMIYSIRTFDKGYRLGYAKSNDGFHFTRADEEMDIDVSESGWDSEMMCFGTRYKFRDKTYLFYCGNHYGIGGMGYAKWEDK